MPASLSIKDLLIFENDDYFAVNKPPFIATLDERQAGAPKGLLRYAKEYVADAQACHRLDKETSGVLLFAKHPEAYRWASLQFEHRAMHKIYHAVVAGIQDFQGVNVFLPIRPTKDGNVVIDREGGKEAETEFNTLDVYKAHTLVQCEPVTGRMHQIRIHLACLKAPIVMDELYGGPPIYLSQIKRKFNLKKSDEEQPLINRVALHSYQLEMMGTDEQLITLTAPYPKDFKALITQLDKNR